MKCAFAVLLLLVSGSVSEWVSGALTPKAPALVPEPITLALTWPDVAGWYSQGDTAVASDGGTRFWTVLSTEDFEVWRVADVVATNRAVVTSTNCVMFYAVFWRNNGPVWSWP